MDISHLHPLLGTSLAEATSSIPLIFPQRGSPTNASAGDAQTDRSPPHTYADAYAYTEKRYPDAIFRTHAHLGLDLVFELAPGSSTAGTSAEEAQKWVMDRVDIYNPASTSAGADAAGGGGAGLGGTRRRAVQKGPTRFAPRLPIRVRLARAPDLPPPPTPKPLSTARTKGEEVIRADAGLGAGSGTGSGTGPSTGVGASAKPSESVSNLELCIDSHTTGAQLVSHLGEPSRKGGGTQWVAPWLEWSGVDVVMSPLASDDEGALGGPGEPSERLVSGTESSGGDANETVRIGIMVELRPPSASVTSDKWTGAERKGEVQLPVGGVWQVAGEWEWECIKVFKAQA